MKKMKEVLSEVNPGRVNVTQKLLSLKATNWDKAFMPMRDYSKDLFGDDTLGIVFRQNPLKIYIGNMFDPNSLAEAETLIFNNIDDMIDAGWLVD